MTARRLSVLPILLLAGCSFLKPGAAYIEADRRTFNDLKPFIDNEKLVQPARAAEITDLQRSWEIRLEAAEAE